MPSDMAPRPRMVRAETAMSKQAGSTDSAPDDLSKAPGGLGGERCHKSEEGFSTQTESEADSAAATASAG